METHIEKEWVTKAGLSALVVFNVLHAPRNIAHRCGYVGVSKDNKAFGVDADGLCTIDVHGGLSYSGLSKPMIADDGLWWLGFDCAHYQDTRDQWTTEAVEAECERLAAQLAS